MSSFVIIELRTTPPNLEIIAPPYTMNGVPTQIEVRSDYALSEGYQDIYLTNTKGERIDLILNPDKYSYSGSHVFNETAGDIYTIHARLKDEVLNLSAEATKTVLLLDASDAKVTVDRDDCMKPLVLSKDMGVTVTSNSKHVVIVEDFPVKLQRTDVCDKVVIVSKEKKVNVEWR